MLVQPWYTVCQCHSVSAGWVELVHCVQVDGMLISFFLSTSISKNPRGSSSKEWVFESYQIKKIWQLLTWCHYRLSPKFCLDFAGGAKIDVSCWINHSVQCSVYVTIVVITCLHIWPYFEKAMPCPTDFISKKNHLIVNSYVHGVAYCLAYHLFLSTC